MCVCREQGTALGQTHSGDESPNAAARAAPCPGWVGTLRQPAGTGRLRQREPLQGESPGRPATVLIACTLPAGARSPLTDTRPQLFTEDAGLFSPNRSAEQKLGRATPPHQPKGNKRTLTLYSPRLTKPGRPVERRRSLWPVALPRSPSQLPAVPLAGHGTPGRAQPWVRRCCPPGPGPGRLGQPVRVRRARGRRRRRRRRAPLRPAREGVGRAPTVPTFPTAGPGPPPLPPPQRQTRGPG